MVGVAGFEPATPASRKQCSTGLSHTPTENAAYSLRPSPPQGAELRNLFPVNPTLETRILPAGQAAVTAAARVLASGGLVAFPTETVYGLGADARNSSAVKKIFAMQLVTPLALFAPDEERDEVGILGLPAMGVVQLPADWVVEYLAEALHPPFGKRRDQRCGGRDEHRPQHAIRMLGA